MISSQLYVGVGEKITFYRMEFLRNIGNNQLRGKLRANYFLTLITILCTG